jgi:SHS2 domain-containing protein
MHELFEHTADLGLRIRAGDLPGLFADAGRALFSAIVEDLDSVRPAREVQLNIEAELLDELLRDWLAELLYRFHAEHMLFSQFDVALEGTVLAATARGEPIDTDRHRIEGELKAVTYHRLKVEQEPDGSWLAEVIVDT